MNERPHPPVDNVVELRIRPPGASPALAAPAAAGGHNDPRTQEALRLIGSFLAIEDASARAALIALAESLVTHDWLRRTEQR